MERVIPVVLNGEPRLICEADLRNICALENIPYDSPPPTPVNQQITENQPPPTPSQEVQTASVQTSDPEPALESVPFSLEQNLPLTLIESGNLIAAPILADNTGGETFSVVNTGPGQYHIVASQPTELVISPEEQNGEPDLSEMLRFVQPPGQRAEVVASPKSDLSERHKEVTVQMKFSPAEEQMYLPRNNPIRYGVEPESLQEENCEVLIKIQGVGVRKIIFPCSAENIDFNLVAEVARQVLPMEKKEFVATKTHTRSYVTEEGQSHMDTKEEAPEPIVEPESMEVDPPADSTVMTPQPVPPLTPAQALFIARSANTLTTPIVMRPAVGTAGQTLVVSQTQPMVVTSGGLTSQLVAITQQPIVTTTLGPVMVPIQIPVVQNVVPKHAIKVETKTEGPNAVVSNGVKDNAGGGKPDDPNQLVDVHYAHCDTCGHNSRDLKVCQKCRRPLPKDAKIISQKTLVTPQASPSKPPAEHFKCYMTVRCEACGRSSLDTSICTNCKKLLPENAPKVLVRVKLPGTHELKELKKSLKLELLDPSLRLVRREVQKVSSVSRHPGPKLDMDLRSEMKNLSLLQSLSPTQDRRKGKKKAESKKRKCQRKKKVEEPVTLSLLSSDEEEDPLDHSEKKTKPAKVISKEPIITEDTESPFQNERIEGGGLDMEGALSLPGVERALVCCRSVRIGSYKTCPDGKVAFTEWGFFLSIPSLGRGDLVTIKVLKSEIVKVLANFGKNCPVLFYYTTARAADRLRRELQMRDSQRGPWYDPTSREEMHRRITILPDKVSEETRLFLRTTYDNQCLLETLSPDEVDAILVQASPAETPKSVPLQPQPPQPPVQAVAPLQTPRSRENFMQPPGTPLGGNPVPGTPVAPHLVQRIMVYPPPPAKGGISINTEDYGCLGEENFLNDVIIDFYLKYFVQTQLSPEDQKRTHIFSSFFYKRLTTKDPPLSGDKRSAAERRHNRVRGWTKQVDLFSKDFILIPINENSHWFLGVVCFPGLIQAVRISDGKPVPNPSKRRGHIPHVIGGTTITRVNQEPMTITLEPDEEDRDEADADDEDLEPNSSDEETGEEPEGGAELLDDATHPVPKVKPKKEPQEPIKQPCILIFDSLAGASRSKVCATLREYLQIEYNVRHRDSRGKRDINKNTMKASVVKVPQQTNYTDCGLYVLQYTEAFFQSPIVDYRMPIKQLVDWFDTTIVSRKRYQIQQLLHQLMDELKVDTSRLNLPVLNLHPEGTGKPYNEEEDEEGMEDMEMLEDFEEMGDEEMMGEEEEEEEMREFARTVSRASSSIPSLPTVVQQIPTTVQQVPTPVQQSPAPSPSTAPPSEEVRVRKPRKEITISSSVAPSISSAISITPSPVAVPSPVKTAPTTPTPTLPQSISLTRKFIATPDSTSASKPSSHLSSVNKLEGISITPTAGSNSVKRKGSSVTTTSTLKDVRNPRLPSQTPPAPSRSVEIKKVRPE